VVKERPKLVSLVLWLVSRNSLDKEFNSFGPSTENGVLVLVKTKASISFVLGL